jgi:hypothetical protein
MMRHNFTLRQPENLPVAQSTVATEKTRKEFFDKRSSLISELKITGAVVVSTV